MGAEERLARLVAELGAKASYATGSRAFPSAVSDEDAVAIAAALAAEVDVGVAERARLGVQSGFSIACQGGCNACCEVMVMVYAPEALAIARWLEQPENAAARSAFLDEFPRWRAAVGDAPERLSDAWERRDTAGYDALHIAHWRRRVMCAFNRDGLCGVYPVRPLGCRNAHAVGNAERCVADPPGGRPAEALSFVPLEQFLRRANQLLRATHNAIAPRRHRSEAVCSAVHGFLGATRATITPSSATEGA